MDGIIYLVGLVVVVLAILSFLGLHWGRALMTLMIDRESEPSAVIDRKSEPSAAARLDSSYVDWEAIVGGAVVAVVIFTTLTAFGSAVGLSLTSAEPGQGISAKLAAIAIALWTAWMATSSFAAGGYISGRLRHRIAVALDHEVRIRDGVHGLIAWSIAAIISGLVLASSLGSTANSATKEAAKTTQDYQLGLLFRGEETTAADLTARLDAETVLKTITARKSLSQDDEAYVAQLVSKATSISPAEAKSRVVSVEHNIQIRSIMLAVSLCSRRFSPQPRSRSAPPPLGVQRSPAANTGMRDRC